MNLASFSVPKMSESYLPFLPWFAHYSQLLLVAPGLWIALEQFPELLQGSGLAAVGLLLSPQPWGQGGDSGAGMKEPHSPAQPLSWHCLWHCSISSPWHSNNSSTKHTSRKKKSHFLRNWVFFCVWIFFMLVQVYVSISIPISMENYCYMNKFSLISARKGEVLQGVLSGRAPRGVSPKTKQSGVTHRVGRGAAGKVHASSHQSGFTEVLRHFSILMRYWLSK